MKYLFLTLLFSTLVSSLFAFSKEERGQILFFLHKEQTSKAFNLYLQKQSENSCHDFDLLREMGMMLLMQGAKSRNKEIQLLSLFGASIASNTDLLPIFEKGIESNEMTIQLAALAGLAELQDDQADLLLIRALSSTFLLTRFEAAYTLAQKNDAAVLLHLHSLLTKVPTQLRPLFPQILVKLKGPAATHLLKQLLNDVEVDVKIETIRYAAKEGRDDLLPQIQSLATSPNHGQQEACLFALGRLQDTSSLPLLRHVANFKEGELKIAAAASLFSLGEESAIDSILKEAGKENPFAIILLGKIGSKVSSEKRAEILASLEALSKSPNATLRFNCGVALLGLREDIALGVLKEFILSSHRGSGILPVRSAGQTLTSFRVIPSAELVTKQFPDLISQTTKVKIALLNDALELSEDLFLKLAEAIFASSETVLIPHVIELLCHHKNERIMQFFLKEQQKAGAPLVRNFCLLALYRLGEEKATEDQIIALIEREQKTALIRLKEEKTKSKKRLSHYLLSPEESSLLLLSALELLVSKQNEKGITALVRVMTDGHPNNKYPLAGFLIKGTE